jgi:hypothetical protein
MHLHICGVQSLLDEGDSQSSSKTLQECLSLNVLKEVSDVSISTAGGYNQSRRL